MTNLITSILLLAISLFVINLFPMGKTFLASIVDTFNEKKTNITEEYERVKGEVEDVKETVTETKAKVDSAVEKVEGAVDTVNNTMDKANDLLGGDEEETTDSASSETMPQ